MDGVLHADLGRAARSPCPRRRPSAASTRRTLSGRSCTPSWRRRRCSRSWACASISAETSGS